MNKIVLIGNGFDLAHGLKTRYTDFILWYLNFRLDKLIYNNNDNKDNLIKFKLSRSINETVKIQTFSDFFNFLDSHDIKITGEHDFISDIIKLGSETNWIDIESIYYKFLVNIYTSIEKRVYNFEVGKTQVKLLNQCFEEIKYLLIAYLNSNITNKINEQLIRNDINLLMRNDIRGNSSAINNIYFLNFNYTPTIELYLTKEIFGILPVVNYIHGSLNDPNNPIIFGYGDEIDPYYEKIENLNENEFLNNIKSFSYFKTKNYKNFSRYLDEKRFIVYIMGHSCGLSDRILLNSIFEHPNCESIKIYYHKINDNENDFKIKTQEISRHFKPSNKGKMRNLIVNENDSIPLTK